MMDWISSKTAMVVAALLLLSSVGGVFILVEQHAGKEELKNELDLILTAINKVTNADGCLITIISWDTSKGGDYILRSQVRGNPYTIVFKPDVVEISQDRDKISAMLPVHVHLWKPNADTLNTTTISQKDVENAEMRIVHGQDIIVEKRINTGLNGAGIRGYEIFIYI